MKKIILALCAGFLSAQVLATTAITVVIPNGPGSVTDTLSRYIGKELESKYQMQVTFENHAGADQVIGMNRLLSLKNPAVMFAGTTLHVFGPVLNPGQVDDAKLDTFAMIAQTPVLWFANPKSGLRTTKDLVDALKSNRKLNIGSDNLSNRVNVVAMLEHYRSSNSALIKYKTPSQVVVDVVGGSLDVGVIPATPALLGLIKEGKITALANTTDRDVNYNDQTVPSIAKFTRAPKWLSAVFASTAKDNPLPPTVTKDIVSIIESDDYKTFITKMSLLPGTGDKVQTQQIIAGYQQNLRKLSLKDFE